MWAHTVRERFHFQGGGHFVPPHGPWERTTNCLCASPPDILLETVWFARRAEIFPACWLFSPEHSALSVLHPAGAGWGGQVEQAAGDWVARWRPGDRDGGGLFVGWTDLTGTTAHYWSVWGQRGMQLHQHSERSRILSEKCYFQESREGLRSDHVTGRPLKVEEFYRCNQCAPHDVEKWIIDLEIPE